MTTNDNCSGNHDTKRHDRHSPGGYGGDRWNATGGGDCRITRARPGRLEVVPIVAVDVGIGVEVGPAATRPGVDVLAGVVQAFLKEILIVVVDLSVAVEIPAAVDGDNPVSYVIPSVFTGKKPGKADPCQCRVLNRVRTLGQAFIEYHTVHEPAIGLRCDIQ